MRILVPIVMVLSVMTWIAQGGAPSPSDFRKFVPTGPFVPYTLPDRLQEVATSSGAPARFQTLEYLKVLGLKNFSDQSFYVDMLAAVDVIAQAWSSRRGKPVTSEGYKALLCFFSFPLPGCRPKSEENRRKMIQMRERLVAGAYGSAEKRSGIADRLTAFFFQLEVLEGIDTQTRGVEQYIRLSDLR